MSAKPLLQRHLLLELSIINDFEAQPSREFRINPKINFTLSPSPDKKQFIGDFSLEIGDMDDGSPLYIKLRLKGFFAILKAPADSDVFDPEAFNRAAFPQIFDIARTIIAGTMQSGGMKPLLLNQINPAQLDVHTNT